VVFRDSLVAMQDEIIVAYPDNIEAIVQPRRDEARALAALMGVFLEARREAIASASERSEAEEADAKALVQIQRLPDLIRSVVTRGLAEALARAENPPAAEGDVATLPPVRPGTPDGTPD
jgi:hypothetical protein